MSADVVAVESVELGGFPVEVWTINRPDKLNALNGEVLLRLDREGRRLVDELKANPTKIRALILKGAGEKAFVAGADIAEMRDFTPAQAEAFSRLGQAAFGRLEELPIPTIAALKGFTLGGGLELAMGCDVLVATPQAEFGQPEAYLGLLPGFGATARFAQRLGLGKALELLYSGRRLKADEALRLGLVQRLAADGEDVFEFAKKVALEFLTKSGPLALARIKAVTRSASREWVQRVCDAEAKAFGEIFASDDKREGVAAFLEKRPAKFTGR